MTDIFSELAETQKNSEETLANIVQPWSSELVISLAGGVLGFTLLVILFSLLVLWQKDFEAIDLLRVVGILSIVGMSALLLVVGYSNEQLTPIIGLFGAICGYLLGKGKNS